MGIVMAMSPRKQQLRPIGWREWIVMPDLCPTPVKVKIDTGATTSALHAFRLRITESDHGPTATFVMHPHQRSTRDSVRVEADIIDFRKVRSSNGKVERRPVIAVQAVIGDTTFPMHLTLTRRDVMSYRMLLGREALRKRFMIDPGRSFVATPKELGTIR